MIRIAVVEDDRRSAEQYGEFLHQYEQETGEHFHITNFSDGDEIAEEYRPDYDIILMDIEMRFLNGMKAAEMIRQVDEGVVIIFMTNMPQYAMEGYKVGALDYVLKPITYYSFSQRIERAIARIRRRPVKFITLQLKNGFQKLNINDILYIEVQNHDLLYYTKDRCYTTRGSMKDIEEQLTEYHFYRCNKCYLINLEHVDRLEGQDVTVGPYMIQVSRSKRKEFLDVLNNYMNEVSG